MKPSSSSFEPRSALLGAPLFGDPDVDAAICDRAIVAAMLDVEGALAAAGADAGLVPRDAAEAIGAACRWLQVDPGELGVAAAAAGNPVPALVRRLAETLPEPARPWVHHGATSQDVLDTALVLVSRRAAAAIVRHVRSAADGCAVLAAEHRDTVMVGRTLGQQATPTTFGRKVAGWLVALDDAADGLDNVRAHRLAVQLGGAVGTLAAYGERGDAVVAALAARLDLCAPVLPWHTDRLRVVDLATAAARVAAACGKLAGDVSALAQTEVGEVSLAESGGSSAMPHKRNPIDAVLVTAGARQAPGLVATLLAATDHEHERAAGAWHAEWQPLLGLLGVVGGVAARTARLAAGLHVHPDRMRANVDRSGGLVMAEAVAARLASTLGRTRAHDLVGRCAATATREERSFRDVLLDDPEVAGHLSADDIDAALDPASWLGSAGPMVDRAIEAHERRRR